MTIPNRILQGSIIWAIFPVSGEGKIRPAFVLETWNNTPDGVTPKKIVAIGCSSIKSVSSGPDQIELAHSSPHGHRLTTLSKPTVACVDWVEQLDVSDCNFDRKIGNLIPQTILKVIQLHKSRSEGRKIAREAEAKDCPLPIE